MPRVTKSAARGPAGPLRSALGAIALAGLAGLAGACASTGAVPRPFPVPGGPPPAATAPAPGAPPAQLAPDTAAIVDTALAMRGTPYRNGGSDPDGFDCSGFTQFVFAQHGVVLPREVRDQYQAGAPVRSRELEPGDLVFFTTVAPGASHVGIAIGGDAFVHAPSSTGVVRVERLSSTYWSHRYLGARRVSDVNTHQ